LLNYLTAHPFVEHTASALAQELGLTPTQVSNAIGHLAMNLNIQRPMNGVYRYIPGPRPQDQFTAPTSAQPAPPPAPTPPPAKPTPTIFEKLGTAANGDVILEAEDGTLWRGSPL